MNVLFISYDGLSDPLGQSQILPYIRGLSAGGFVYSIISFEKKSERSEETKNIKETLQKSNIRWINLKYTKNPPVLSTLYDLIKLKSAIKKEIRDSSIDVIHCRSYISMYAAFPLAKKYGIRIVFDQRGFWIDERVEGFIWNINNPLFGFIFRHLKKKEKLWMESSDAIVCLTEKGKNYIQKTYPTAHKRSFTVIPCAADENLFDPQKIENAALTELKSQCGIKPSDKVLIYAGSVGTWYMTKEMMISFAGLEEQKMFHKFLWITGEEPEVILQLADLMNIKREKIIVRRVTRNQMPLYLSMGHVGIFYIRPTFSKIASSPTKLAEMMMMGLPIICNRGVGDLDDYFVNNKIGICTEISGIEKIAATDVEFLFHLDKSFIRKRGIKLFGLSQAVEKYSRLLNDLK